MARINESVFKQYRDGQDRLTAPEYMRDRQIFIQSINDLEDKYDTTNDIKEQFIELSGNLNENQQIIERDLSLLNQKTEEFQDEIGTALEITKNKTGKSIDSYKRLAPETNDNGKLQRAFDDLKSGDTLVFPYGQNYSISSVIKRIGVENISIVGYGATIDASKVPSGSALIHFTGTLESELIISSDLKVGDKTVTLSDTSTLNVGDIIYIRDDSLWNTYRPEYKRGELQSIKSIDSTTQITLDTPVFDKYSVPFNARINKMNPVEDLIIQGLKIIGGGKGLGHQGILVTHGKNVIIKDCTVINSEVSGISLSTIFGLTVNDNWISGSNHINTGYGISVSSATRGYTIDNNKIYNCRHAFTTGGTSIVRLGSVINNHAWNCISYAFDTHGGTDFITFSNNTAVMSEGGIQVRGKNSIIVNNHIVMSPFSSASVIQTAEEGGVNLTVADNHIYGGSKGIALAHGKVTFANIKGNVIEGCTWGIYIAEVLEKFDFVDVYKNTILKSKSNGIRVIGHSNFSINDNTIVDSSLNNPGATHAINLENYGTITFNNIQVKRNKIFDTGETPTTNAGIYVGSNYMEVDINENDIRRTTNKINIASTSAKIRKQRERNEGSAYIPAGSTAIEVPHGLSKTPTKILVTPYGAPSATWSIRGFNATTFTILMSAAPATNQSFYWDASVEI